jgi:hypothetical protein
MIKSVGMTKLRGGYGDSIIRIPPAGGDASSIEGKNVVSKK